MEITLKKIKSSCCNDNKNSNVYISLINATISLLLGKEGKVKPFARASLEQRFSLLNSPPLLPTCP